MPYKTYILFILVISLLACQGKRRLLNAKLDATETKYASQIGFVLYDLENNKTIVYHQGDKLFIPASNMKLYTFYAGLCSLEDSVPTLAYEEKSDSLFFVGLGDPSFLHPEFNYNKAFDFLKKSDKKLFLVNTPEPNSWAPGWQWDDFNESFQTDVCTMPLYGNKIWLHSDSTYKLQIEPKYFLTTKIIQVDSTIRDYIKRDYWSNKITFGTENIPKKGKLAYPIKTNKNLSVSLLADTLKKNIALIDRKNFAPQHKVYNLGIDTLYKKMLLESDNLIAEQLVVMAKTDTKTWGEIYFSKLPLPLKWVDGSGLSRLNLSSPSNTIQVLRLLYKKITPSRRLFSYLPEGGKNGTLKNMYKTIPHSVFAKTGSMQGVYNQSGYLISKSGKYYAFSYMNNNFAVPTSQIRKEVEDIIVWIYSNY